MATKKKEVKHKHGSETHSHDGGNKKHTHKESVTIKTKEVKPTNVYSADYSVIDSSIEEIKKASRKVSTNSYATNNVYIILQDALKKVLNAEK